MSKHPVIALIPAREGSKGVVRKNMRTIAGTPLIAFTIQAALNSRFVDQVYLSSDSDEILAFGKNSGVRLIHRPSEFASDTASAIDVVKHFLGEIPSQLVEENPYILYLQPTSPLRSAKHIDMAMQQMMDQSAHTLVSVVEMAKSPYKSFLIDIDGRLQSIFDEKMSNACRQELPKAYIPNGAIYVFRVSDFLERNGFPSNGGIPFVMSEADSLDIDTEEDIEYLVRVLRERNG